MRWLVFIMMVLMGEAVIAQPVFTKEQFIQGADILPYRLLYPPGYNAKKTYPLVVFLHGSGVRGNDNEAQLKFIPPAFTNDSIRNKYPFLLLVPQCPKNDVWVNFPAFPNSLHATDTPTTAANMVIALVREYISEKKADKKQVIITGLSMGGEGTLDIIAREPNLFAKAVAICPVGDTSTAASIRHMPLWIFHGDADNVNEVKYSRIMVNALKQAGSKVRYTEYPGVGHKCWDKAYAAPGLIDWLFANNNRK